MYVYVHSQHHQIGSSITALGTAFGDALDVGLCFVAFHLLLALYVYHQPAWNAAAMVLLVAFEVRPSLTLPCHSYKPLQKLVSSCQDVGQCLGMQQSFPLFLMHALLRRIFQGALCVLHPLSLVSLQAASVLPLWRLSACTESFKPGSAITLLAAKRSHEVYHCAGGD